jgi:metal-dependent amidase/aminoacylase/carboxypeptidase family protein
MAANVVVRLQGIVSREVDPNDTAVVTVGSLQAGQTENVISEYAEIGIDIRSVKPETRTKVLAAVRRIVKAECEASGATKEPIFKLTRYLPNTVNDGLMTKRLATSFTELFGDNFNPDIPITTIAEDFSILGTSQGRPCAFWHFGGTDESLWDRKVSEGKMEDVPMNHSSNFAPVIHPTMRTGVKALCIAALTFLNKSQHCKL